MINNPPPCKRLNIKIPIIIPIKGRGSINRGSGSGLNGARGCDHADVDVMWGAIGCHGLLRLHGHKLLFKYA